MIENSIKRIQLLGLTCDIETENGIRHFHNGHEYVEIGSIKWATMNVGATSPTESGMYFQWGDTKGYTDDEIMKGEKYFFYSEYKFFNPSRSVAYTKYNYIDGKTVLDAEDDAVTAAWGKGWRMPTKEEFETLYNAVNTSWATNYKDSGVNGLLCVDKKDSAKVLFLPEGGAYNFRIKNYAKSCYYWTASLSFVDSFGARADKSRLLCNTFFRHVGLSVRGIFIGDKFDFNQ